MSIAQLRAHSAVERFFEFSMLGMAATGFGALANSRAPDWPTIGWMVAALSIRAYLIARPIRLPLPARTLALAAIACAAFFPLDFYFLSRSFFLTALHGVCFLTGLITVTARRRSDYLYIGSVAFLQILGAAFISFRANFLGWLAFYALFAIAALTSSEIRRSLGRHTRIVHSPGRMEWRLTALAFLAAGGILIAAAGLFLVVPRTARAAAMLFPDGPRMTGYSNIVDLGTFGRIGEDRRPVMHVLSWAGPLPAGVRWRGTALSRFDGKRWTEPLLRAADIPHQGTIEVAGPLQRSRRDARRLLYRVEVNRSDTGTLFIAGIPEFINISATRLLRTEEDSFRVLPATGEPLQYEISAHPGPALPVPLSAGERARYLQLPPVDRRIWGLARAWAGEVAAPDRALRIENRLRTGFAYTLGISGQPGADPLAEFLFATKRGYCQYFASAMAVMLRTLGTPSRIVTGFQRGSYSDLSGMYVVRASDAHAWVEGWIKERGWVTFDPTPSGPVAPPGVMSRLDIYLDALDSTWRQWVVSYDTTRQAALAVKFAEGLRSLRNRSGGTSGTWRSFSPRVGWWVALCAVVIAALYWLPTLLRRNRSQVRLRRAMRGGALADVSALYEHMLARVAARGLKKPASMTPTEFARGLPSTERERVTRFTTLYNSVRFGGNRDGFRQLIGLLRDFGGRTE